MPFWNLTQTDSAPAAIEGRTGRVWTYGDLRRDAERIGRALPRVGRKTLGLILAQNQYECLAAYVGALQAGACIALLDANLSPSLLAHVLDAYGPDWIFGPGPFPGYVCSEPGLWISETTRDIDIHPELALLLSTSGSTGSPKMVRLSSRNIDANAASIAEYLQLGPDERPITSLPMAYSYGLSVINSHLHSGAAVVFSDDAVMRKEFWDALDRHRCTSFGGVPYTYQTLLTMGLLKTKGTSLKTLTQAGGRLESRYVEKMHELAVARGWKFVVMYGQTEAAPRISYVPFEDLGRKVGSIGIPVPGGALHVDDGELVYSGPNVMLGYAYSRDDLAKADELGGVLRTGDLARRDDDGYFYITGRLKRFLKLFGKRFNLDEAERILAAKVEYPVACYGSDDVLLAAVEPPGNPEALLQTICDTFDLPRAAVKVRLVSELPRNANGKVDYKRLT
jgi:acyl-CoA synthetase (AMP-forming)/AMP-acid ligase II